MWKIKFQSNLLTSLLIIMKNIHPDFQSNIPIMIDIFKKYKIKNAYLFGSVLTDKFNDKSDLDILINFQNEVTDPLLKGELLWSLQFAIEDALHLNVDLLQETTPKNPYFIKELLETRQLIYEQ